MQTGGTGIGRRNFFDLFNSVLAIWAKIDTELTA